MPFYVLFSPDSSVVDDISEDSAWLDEVVAIVEVKVSPFKFAIDFANFFKCPSLTIPIDFKSSSLNSSNTSPLIELEMNVSESSPSSNDSSQAPHSAIVHLEGSEFSSK